MTNTSPSEVSATGMVCPTVQSTRSPMASITSSSCTLSAGVFASTGMATRAASAPVSFSASSATRRNTVAGSAPDNNSVAMSRVDSIHACRALACW
ncbi:Uncharacterised protein [Mycobacterium tuberculosis]|nr:Uncharacterised protein [Mycobacterium tuberculosis]